MTEQDISTHFDNVPKAKLYHAYKLFFGTLTSKDRLLILNMLRKGPRTVNALQKSLQMEQTRVSHNLQRLRSCGFVEVEQKGKNRFYSLNKKTIAPIMDSIGRHMEQYCLKIVSRHEHKQ